MLDIGSEILSQVTIFSKYAKYSPEVSRREVWDEIVDRYEVMMLKKYPQLKRDIMHWIGWIREKKVLPSMRALQFAGIAIERAPSRIYNCCYLPIDSIHSFSETMFLLLGGTGVGYSVQFSHIDKLPEIRKSTRSRRYLIGDSIEGWADAVKALMKAYFGLGTMPRFDYSDIRPKGARLVTAGGKAPGPDPLKECLEEVRKILERKKDGEKLTDIECHDILCHIANAVLAGGIRRAAMIALFSMDSGEMIGCKSSSIFSSILEQTIIDNDTISLRVAQEGVVYENKIIRRDKDSGEFWDLKQYETTGTLGWWVCNEQRGRANNSASIVRSRVTEQDFYDLWVKIEESGSGEPGFYLTNNNDWGTNPCCEIGLRPYQFCNLCEINVSDIEDGEDLHDRVYAAAFFGTLQAGFTDFHYLREIWKKTTQKDSLLGIGMTGIASGKILKYDLKEFAELAKSVNGDISNRIGINAAARITCVKPSGTTSCVLGTSSGIHAWHSRFYLRTIRFNLSEEISRYLMEHLPEICELDIRRPHDTLCVRIPIKAPEGAIIRENETAISLLERVKKFSEEWVKNGHRSGDNTHNVSATISIDKNKAYGDITSLGLPDTQSSYDEWEVTGKWMWQNRNVYNGLSVLPYDGGSYQQAPFETISEEEYYERIAKLKPLALTSIIEQDDITDLKGEAACSGGKCEI